MNEPPDNRAQRAEPENDDGDGLNGKTWAALFDGLSIADHVENAAGDPDHADRGGDRVADIDGEQPQRGQENRLSVFIWTRNMRSKSGLPVIAGNLTPKTMRALATWVEVMK